MIYATDVSTNTSDGGLWIVYGDQPTLSNSTIHCSLHKATYSSQVNFTNNLLNVTTEITLQEQIWANTGSLDYMGQSPPSEQPELRVILNMYTIHEALMTLLSGYLVVVNAFGACRNADRIGRFRRYKPVELQCSAKLYAKDCSSSHGIGETRNILVFSFIRLFICISGSPK